MSRPVQIQFLSRFAAAYDPVVQLMGFGPLWRAIAEVAAPSPGQWVLDVCTGTGGAAGELHLRGARVVGVDLASGLLLRAVRKRRAAHLLRMDARQLAFHDRSFRLITCSMALHEMAPLEREQSLGEIARVASDRVVIAEYRVPRGFPCRLLFRTKRAFEYVESDDFASFVQSDFRALLEHTGFITTRPRDIGAYRIWPCSLRAA
jgi:ubiquinone/menaquinone biosynthesis C-methylase UbiE